MGQAAQSVMEVMEVIRHAELIVYSPICDEGHHSAFELLDTPSLYRNLWQNSGRCRPIDPATSMGHSRASVALD